MGKKNYISRTENKPWIDNQYTNKMLKKHTYFFIFLLLLVGITGFSQTFPVSISTQINQPSPIYWSNYADATTSNSPIKMQIVLNDLTIANRQVRIKCYWQGNGISFMNNDFVVGAQPLFLEGGVPLQLTNVNLAPYFEFQNIMGITPNQYAQAMPEGIYTFAVEVYDVATGQKLSRKSTVTVIIFQNESPLLNLPLNQVSIIQQNIQNILFSWTPRQINVSNVEYQFDLIEIWDQYTPVQNAFAYSKPIYTTTTRATTLQYGVAEPQLITGKRYAWRIKAKALVGAEEIGVFKNNGYSEIFAFTYEVYCTPPLLISTEGVSQDQAKITWSGALDNFDYQVNYREKNADSQWYPLETPRENATLANLKPNTTYEYTVGASCEKGKYVHNSIQEFTTLAQDEIAFTGCGIKPDPNDLENQTPLLQLFPNDVITAGDFPIVVLQATGGNGTFSGDGYVTLPFLEKFRKLIDAADALGGEKSSLSEKTRIKITFDYIGVNTDFKLISGEIIAGYDEESWDKIIDVDKLADDIAAAIAKDAAVREKEASEPEVTQITEVPVSSGQEPVTVTNPVNSINPPISTVPTKPINVGEKPVVSNNPASSTNPTNNSTTNNNEPKKEIKTFSSKEIYAIGVSAGAIKFPRIAMSDEILYYIDAPTFKNEEKRVTFKIVTTPNYSEKIIDKENLRWSINGTQKPEYTGIKQFERKISEKDDITTVDSYAGYPNSTNKSIKIKWVDQDYSSNTVGAEGAKLLKIRKTLQELARFLFIRVVDRANKPKGEKDNALIFDVSYQNTIQNREGEKSRLYYKETESVTKVELGAKLGYEAPVPGLAIPGIDRKLFGQKVEVQFGLYWFIGAQASGTIGTTETKKEWIENSSLNTTTTVYGKRSNIALDATVGLNPKFVIKVPGISGEVSAKSSAKIKLVEFNIKTGEVTFPLKEEGIPLECTPITKFDIFGFNYSHEWGKYKHTIRFN